jgi:hypothetical protein
MGTLDLNRVVELVREQGVDAFVEFSGGVTATVYIGPTSREEGSGDRYALLAGPGWFEGAGRPVAAADGLSVGPDDDGTSEPWYCPADGDEALVARKIVELIGTM